MEVMEVILSNFALETPLEKNALDLEILIFNPEALLKFSKMEAITLV